MNQRNQNSNNGLQTALLLVAVALLAYVIYLMTGSQVSSYRAPVQPVQQPETGGSAGSPTGSIIIQEQPAVIIATGVPSVPVVAPAVEAVPTATAVPTPTHAPLPANMQEAHEQGYWPMPITLEQYNMCVADPAVNPACQFYVGGE